MKSFKFIISGKVQGVYYRKSIVNKAQRKGYSGYIKNLNDKTVEAVVTCNEESVSDFIAMLKEGSVNSVVKDIKQFDTDEICEGKFRISNAL